LDGLENTDQEGFYQARRRDDPAHPHQEHVRPQGQLVIVVHCETVKAEDVGGARDGRTLGEPEELGHEGEQVLERRHGVRVVERLVQPFADGDADPAERDSVGSGHNTTPM
jgi:hypothetical protein